MATGEQIAEFNVIFYGGSTYRIISCANNNQTINFTVFDKNRNKLFNSSEQNNTHYWDFQFESTIECLLKQVLSQIKVIYLVLPYSLLELSNKINDK